MIKILIISLLLILSQVSANNEIDNKNNKIKENSLSNAQIELLMKTFNKVLEKREKESVETVEKIDKDVLKEKELDEKLLKIEKDIKREAKVIDAGFLLERQKPIPLGYSKTGKTRYAYIDFRGKVFKTIVGTNILGFEVTEISKKNVSVISPSGKKFILAYSLAKPTNSKKTKR